MEWKGKDLKTAGDVCDALLALGNHSEAHRFITQARQEGPHADENIGYIIGYLPPEAQDRLYKWMGVKHPVFGPYPPRKPVKKQS